MSAAPLLTNPMSLIKPLNPAKVKCPAPPRRWKIVNTRNTEHRDEEQSDAEDASMCEQTGIEKR